MTNNLIKKIIEEELNRFNGKLYIFDFDETLISDKAKAYVTKKDGTRYSLDHDQYKDYEKENGDRIDISEFDLVMDPVINVPMMNLIKSLQKNSVILTARTKDVPISEFLKSCGVDVPVYAVGTTDPDLISSAYNARKKSDWIKKAIETFQLTFVEFWDDNRLNLFEAEKLKELFPRTEIKTHYVVFKK